MTTGSQAAGEETGLPASSAGRIVAYGNPEKGDLAAVLRAIAGWSARHGAALSVAREIAAALQGASSPADKSYQVYGEEDPAARLFEPGRPALLVSLGGDGTLIRAVRRFWPFQAPVLSINLGSLGFNSSVQPEQTLRALDDWRQGRSPISERMTIRVKWLREGQTLAESVAVNDVVLVKQYEARMIRFILKQGPSELASFAADGLIVATPTGSTAYNLSAGGPIVYPELRTLVVTAVCPHTLSSRPMILPPDPPVVMQFVLRRRRDQAMLWIDGQEHWPIAEGDQVSVEADPWPLRLISSGAEHYFTILRDNLSWSGEPQRSDLSNKAAASCRTPNLF